jgi:RNA polymerase sigma factor (sigma-70 family)
LKSHTHISEFLETIKSTDSDTILENLYLKDTEKLLEKSVQKLPEKCREVFMLSRCTGLDNSEISKKLGISKRTVETHVSNAIRRVKSEIIFPTTILFSIFF